MLLISDNNRIKYFLTYIAYPYGMFVRFVPLLNYFGIIPQLITYMALEKRILVDAWLIKIVENNTI